MGTLEETKELQRADLERALREPTPMTDEMRLWIACQLYEREDVLNDTEGKVDWVRVVNVVARELVRTGFTVVQVTSNVEASS